jgi:hypothetical protein
VKRIILACVVLAVVAYLASQVARRQRIEAVDETMPDVFGDAVARST